MVAYVLIGFLALSAVIFYFEAKNAPTVDPKEPFFHDDYDPDKDTALE